MTKKEFIWLGIRFLGIFQLIISLRSILAAISTFFVILILLPIDSASEKIIFVGLFGSLIDSIVHVLIIIYLLFFGKFIFNIVHRTSSQSLDAVLEKQDYTEILIRFIGFWWLWRVACKLFGALFFVFWNQTLQILANHFNQELMEALSKLQHSIQQNMVWSVLASILLYSVLSWYFLKHGKFFINLLNRLWLGKNEQDLNQNPVNPVNPV
ncbi:MAG: hypothetical protein J7K65_00990 [Planctomycetes bacterium]|nr:hypothetical protein [Planctomycetota bacterium]